LNRGVCVKIFPFSDPILLPLAPTIARTIAEYLQLITQKLRIKSIPQNYADDLIEVQSDLFWQWQLQRSIRQIPTLQYQYVSTIAHKLAAKLSITPIEICQNLDTVILALTAEQTLNEGSCQLELSGWYNEASYIYFQLTPKSIAIWLNYIHDLPIDLLDQDGDQHSVESIDLAIYAHARCCSFLKLANAEKIVTIDTNLQISTPTWLPDLAAPANQLTTESSWLFEHPAEQQLIHALMAVLDVIYGDYEQLTSEQSTVVAQMPPNSTADRQKSPNWSKLTIDLAQSWLEFNRYCQIFGDLKYQNPRLAIARCGLTAISRRYLQLLIENYLGVKATMCL
jgi:hypothetical protein